MRTKILTSTIKAESLGSVLRELGFDWERGTAVLKLTAYDDDGDATTRKISLTADHILLGIRSQYPRTKISFDGRDWDEAIFVGSDDRQIYLTLESSSNDRPISLLSIHVDAKRYLKDCDLMAVGNS